MIVFVHGVPETAEMWDGVRSHLRVESVALSLPGFGCPCPEGFGATKDEYVQWLLDEIDAVGEPVDLIGHDWGAILRGRIATAYGDRINSWVTDGMHFLDPAYVWHDFAQIWQTADAGEEFWANTLETPPSDTAAVYELLGVPSGEALKLVSRIDQTMATSILSLYRSSTPNLAASWTQELTRTSAPGMILLASEDPFGNLDVNVKIADVVGARVEQLSGLGHFWALQAPEHAASLIDQFVQSVN